MGFRFDTQIILYAGLPLILAAFICALFKENGNSYFNTFFLGYGLLTISILSALLIFDQQYYSFFKSHYDALVFGIIEDDTQAVIKSMWTDHPVIRVFLILLLCILLSFFILRKIIKSKRPLFFSNKTLVNIGAAIFFLGFIFLGLRGSVSTFPLENDDTTVSESAFLNFLTPNAIFCLNEAFKEKEKGFNDFDNNNLLTSFGYGSTDEAILEYYGSMRPYDPNLLFSKTPENPVLQTHPPHVVFVLMESFSNYYLDFNQETNFNLLGSLEQHFKQDILFRNFVSDENGTIPSLENLMTSVPYHPIAQTKYKRVQLPTSVAIPYKKAGYETIFITGGKLGWRNLNDFVPKQGFDQIYGQAAIKRKIKNAETNEWGVYDEYLFQFAKGLLKENTGKPKFIFMLTTSNHTPYQRPEHYKPYPIIITDNIKQLTNNNPLTLDNFTSFQYSANCFGDFMTVIKNSPLKENTIVTATGDHNTLMLFQYDEQSLKQKRGVPLYLYAPSIYLNNKTIDIKRFGSHKDIFPTLFNISLSNQRYFNSGNDLLSNDSSILFFGKNENNMASAQSGAILEFSSKNPRFFDWKNEQPNKLKEEENASLGNQDLLKKTKSRQFLIQYYFNNFLKNSN